jgi:hypothetical protein
VARTSRGQGGAGGETGFAECEVKRMRPGMGVGEEAGGLGEGEACDQPLADGAVRGTDPCVEPGERVGRRAERVEQRAKIISRNGLARDAGRAARSASVSSGVSSQTGRSELSSASWSVNPLPASMWRSSKPLESLEHHDVSRRFGEDRFVTWWIFWGWDGTAHEHVRSRQPPYVR